MLSILLYLLPFAEYEKGLLALLGIIGAIVIWRSGLIQTLVGGQKQLLDLRSAELQQAKDKNAALELRVKELEEYNRLLILNSRTTMEVAMELRKSEAKKGKSNE